ncbi:MAG TPA: alpha/beta fold hydrolase [Novosphingobium sp.]|nr:alpha/beta fold hydrolase [Novosphingobium sp.]
MIRSFAFASLAALAVASVSPAAAKTTPGEPVTQRVGLDVLAELPAMSDLVLSPDGTKAALTLGGGNDFAYAVIDLVKGGDPKVFAKAETYKSTGQRQLTNYRWVDNRYLLLTLTSRENVFGQPADLRRVASYDTQTGKTVPLAWEGATADAGDVLHVDDEKGRILLARQVNTGSNERMFRYEVDWVDVTTGKVLDIVQRTNPIVEGWVADGKGVVRMGLGSDPDTGQQRYLYRSDAGDTLKTVQKLVDKDFVGAGIQPLVFLDEPDMAIVRSNHEGYSAIYKANLKTMTIGEKLFGVPGYDVGSAMVNEDENGVLGYTYATDRPRRMFTEPRLAAVAKFLDEEFGEGNARIVSTNKGDTKLIVALSRPAQNDAFYLYDVASGKFSLIGHESAKLKDGLLNPVEAIRYKASDGMVIQAVVTTPRARAGQRKLPVVVLAHGGPYGVRDYATYDQWAQSIAEQGYVVVQPNYRGSGGYGRAFLKAGRDNGFGTRMQDDLNDVVDRLAAQGKIDPQRACIMGWSYGGYAAARGAQRDPDRWRCAIAGAGVYDLPMMRRSDKEELGKFAAGYLAKGADELDVVSPARHAETKWSPILVVHGAKDPRVPLEQAHTLVANLKKAGKVKGTDYNYIEQPKNGHYGIYFTKEERIEWLGGTAAWLERFNPAYVASDPDFASKPAPDPAIAGMSARLSK